VNIVTNSFRFEQFDVHTKTAMSELFKSLIPGNYEIDWELDERTMPQVKLKFADEAESTMWILKHT